jgi:hypothetical protein
MGQASSGNTVRDLYHIVVSRIPSRKGWPLKGAGARAPQCQVTKEIKISLKKSRKVFGMSVPYARVYSYTRERK